MQSFSHTDSTPQFATAEYAGTAGGGERCEFCTQSIVGRYYRVNSAIACSSCADEAQRKLPKASHSAFVRALVFGGLAAIVGLILYSAFAIITGWMIGFVSLAVGYIVGKAMMKGSHGLGGRRYQITAVLLTYAAVSVAAIPIGISQYAKDKKNQNQAQVHVQQPERAQDARPAQTPEKPTMSVGVALAYLAVLGLASPFLELQDPIHGIIGLVILFVGIQIAWKITAGKPMVEVQGPFDVAPAST